MIARTAGIFPRRGMARARVGPRASCRAWPGSCSVHSSPSVFTDSLRYNGEAMD